MCGRYTLTETIKQVAEQLGANVADSVADMPAERYNIAPSTQIPVMVRRGDDREIRSARWGLVPFWAKDLKAGPKMKNARLETIASKRTYAGPFRQYRAVIPASGFYEWYRPEAGPKQPYYIHPPEGLLTFAGMYSWWRDPTKNDDAEDRWVLSCTIITTEADEAMQPIHNRMHAFLPPDDHDAWLNPETEHDQLLQLLNKAPSRVSRDLIRYPISTAVNRTSNDTVELLTPTGPALD